MLEIIAGDRDVFLWKSFSLLTQIRYSTYDWIIIPYRFFIMNLRHHFLIAMPLLRDPFFENSLVYLCDHGEHGAMGVIVNKPSPVSMDVVFATTGKATPDWFQGQYVMMGGPVQVERGFVVHTPVGNWQSSLRITDNIALTTSRDIIENQSNGDRAGQMLLAIGHSVWTAGQLERELVDNSWLTVPADETILFNLPVEKRYTAALSKLGIRPEMLTADAAHA